MGDPTSPLRSISYTLSLIVDDHWCNILDQQFGLTPQTRNTIYKWGAAKFNQVINLKVPCISKFVECYQQFSIAFPTDPDPNENRWLE